jgi:hypothetical protein
MHTPHRINASSRIVSKPINAASEGKSTLSYLMVGRGFHYGPRVEGINVEMISDE